MKTNELTWPALDWAVAKCEGLNPRIVSKKLPNESFGKLIFIDGAFDSTMECKYSYSWAQAGPIIEREEIALDWRSYNNERCCASYDWDNPYFGPTPLIAAMRCYVASKLGDEVDVPVELE